MTASELWQWDQTVFRDVHLGWHESWLDPIFFIISSSGLGWVQITFIVLLFPWRRFRKSEFAYEGTFFHRFAHFLRFERPLNVPLAVAWLLAGTIVPIIKHEVPRERPSNLIWAHPQEHIFANSYASGHTSTSFAIAWTVFFFTRGTPQAKWGWLALVWAFLVGIARIYRGVHWPSDVVAGFFVGLGCACLTRLIWPDVETFQ